MLNGLKEELNEHYYQYICMFQKKLSLLKTCVQQATNDLQWDANALIDSLIASGSCFIIQWILTS